MGEGKNALTYEDALELCEGHPEVRRVLATNSPKAKPAQKKANSEIAAVRQQSDKHVNTHSKVLLVARLAKEVPEFYKALVAGEYKSPRAAALAAGLVKASNNPLPRLKSFWKKASQKDRKALLKWLESDDEK